MTVHVSKSEFKARALEWFRRIEASGEAVIVTDHGRPTLEIRPYVNPSRQDPRELLKGSVLRLDGPTEPVAQDDWEALH